MVQHSPREQTATEKQDTSKWEASFFSWCLKQSLFCTSWQNYTRQHKLQKSRLLQLKSLHWFEEKANVSISRLKKQSHNGTRSAFREPFKTQTTHNIILKWTGRVTRTWLYFSRQKKHNWHESWMPRTQGRKPQRWELSAAKKHEYRSPESSAKAMNKPLSTGYWQKQLC